METSLEYLTHWEQDALRKINAKRTCESPKILRLFFLLMEADVERKIKALQEYGNEFRCYEKFYNIIKIIATKASYLPESLRQKAKYFISQYIALGTSPVNQITCDSE